MPDTVPIDKGLAEEFEWYKNNQGSVSRKNYFEYIDTQL